MSFSSETSFPSSSMVSASCQLDHSSYISHNIQDFWPWRHHAFGVGEKVPRRIVTGHRKNHQLRLWKHLRSSLSLTLYSSSPRGAIATRSHRHYGSVPPTLPHPHPTPVFSAETRKTLISELHSAQEESRKTGLARFPISVYCIR